MVEGVRPDDFGPLVRAIQWFSSSLSLITFGGQGVVMRSWSEDRLRHRSIADPQRATTQRPLWARGRTLGSLLQLPLWRCYGRWKGWCQALGAEDRKRLGSSSAQSHLKGLGLGGAGFSCFRCFRGGEFQLHEATDWAMRRDRWQPSHSHPLPNVFGRVSSLQTTPSHFRWGWLMFSLSSIRDSWRISWPSTKICLLSSVSALRSTRFHRLNPPEFRLWMPFSHGFPWFFWDPHAIFPGIFQVCCGARTPTPPPSPRTNLASHPWRIVCASAWSRGSSIARWLGRCKGRGEHYGVRIIHYIYIYNHIYIYYIHTHIHIHIHTYIYIHIYIHIYGDFLK